MRTINFELKNLYIKALKELKDVNEYIKNEQNSSNNEITLKLKYLLQGRLKCIEVHIFNKLR
jgi:hypothetical protein